jgi:sugar phosphate isomerase/epimerase
MKLKYYCPIWGMKHLPLEHALEKIKSSGYDGAEIGLNPDIQDIDRVKQLFKDYDLELLAQHPYAKGASRDKLCADYISKLDNIPKVDPIKVNCHTGSITI